MAVLVTGGAGYIGSHTVKHLQDRNEEIIVVDNLQSGHRDSVKVKGFYSIDLRNEQELQRVFKEHHISGVIHFAANSLVGESMKKPYEYYHNNVFGMMTLLKVMKDHGTDKIVFSSTAATYGEPEESPITENCPTNPTNPYGETKLAMEKMMKWFDQAYGIRYVSLRYFNAAGAHYSGLIGEAHDPETHLIPLILQVPLGKRDKISIFGDDYDTKDGTCIRDYIHVNDLADAHIRAMEYIAEQNRDLTLNLATGEGYTVLEVIREAEKVSGKIISYQLTDRRPGDPPELVAVSNRAYEQIGWKAVNSRLDQIVNSMWDIYNSEA